MRRKLITMSVAEVNVTDFFFSPKADENVKSMTVLSKDLVIQVYLIKSPKMLLTNPQNHVKIMFRY